MVKPCGSCTACQQVENKTAFDVTWIVPEKRSRQISISQIRERLIPAIMQTSLQGGWKSGVIIAADRMHQAAANCFLKTLEEPPQQTIFLLLSDSPQNLLPTIISRCQRIDVSNASTHSQVWWHNELLEMLADPGPAGPVSAMGLAARISALLAEVKKEAQKSVMAEYSEDEEAAINVSTDELDARIEARFRESRQTVLNTMQCWYRDLLAFTVGADSKTIHYPQYTELMQARAQNLTLAQALANIDAVDGIKRQLECNMSEPYVLSYWLDRVSNGLP
jgi:DNA polymerase-3 subunit delta'